MSTIEIEVIIEKLEKGETVDLTPYYPNLIVEPYNVKSPNSDVFVENPFARIKTHTVGKYENKETIKDLLEKNFLPYF